MDVAKILGYSNTRKAIWNHFDSDDKQQIFTHHTSLPKMGTVGPKCWGPETRYQQNNSWGPKMGPITKPGVTNCDAGLRPGALKRSVRPGASERHLRVVYVHLSTSLVFTPSYYPQNWKLPKKFKHWVTSQVLPSIRKYGQYKLFDNPYNKMTMIGNELNETDLQ